MPMWTFLLMIVAGFLAFGFVYDRKAKTKRTDQELQTSIQNSNSSNIVYQETFLTEARNDMNSSAF